MTQKDIEMLTLYDAPFPSSRTGALYNAFSYPTKISAEAEAIFIACHTSPGDTVLDPFGGSGTTGIAAKLAARPTEKMIRMADSLGLRPKWGPRRAVVYELSVIGSMLGRVLCDTDPVAFQDAASRLLARTKEVADSLYSIIDNDGNPGLLRFIVWSDVIVCPHCHNEVSYADCCVRSNPFAISDKPVCPSCKRTFNITAETHTVRTITDRVLNTDILQRKRVPYKIYGITGTLKWSRLCTADDIEAIIAKLDNIDLKDFPEMKIRWGMLYRSGYHSGITHLHQFYTSRNAFMMNLLWNEIKKFPADIQDALKVFVLSYNVAHSTLMTRVVAKKNSQDFVVTGAQPGVLYISNLPVEKNIHAGLQRKLKTFADALKSTFDSPSEVTFINRSSLNIDLPDKSVDYIFTDPPFGDYIPYSEINQFNELWLENTTDNSEEVIINPCQNKDIHSYERLMKSVFSQSSRVLKDDGWCTVVFHSAKAEIWQSLYRVFKDNGLTPFKASILDKLQTTFIQTGSTVKVKGDPLILLSKCKTPTPTMFSSDEVLSHVLSEIPLDGSDKTSEAKRYSEYIRLCFENGLMVELNANSCLLHGQSD